MNIGIKHLKRIRIAVSILFFIPVLFVFLDFANLIPGKVINYILYLQFGPSLLKFATVFGISAAGFLFILILSVLFGRVYCSSICPLGTLQDFTTYISLKFRKKKKRKFDYSKPFTITRYFLLTITTVFLLAGSVLVLNLLDPYSNFGRISTQFLKPIYIALNNIGAMGLEKMNVYWLYQVEGGWKETTALFIPAVVLIVLLYMAIRYGRLYCNVICPVGTFLGMISKFSIVKITIADDKCNSCSLCSRVCKASCIDYEKKEIDYTRCVSCFNCLASCNRDAMKFKIGYSDIEKAPDKKLAAAAFTSNGADLSKRGFITGMAFLGMAFLGLALKPGNEGKGQGKHKHRRRYGKGCKGHGEGQATTIPENKQHPVTPPGSINVDHFTSRCTGCTLCVSACPSHVLQPSLMQFGLAGFMIPHMDAAAGYCNYDCTICGDVCPTGAILPRREEDKKLIQLGKAHFIKENCVVETEGTDCGACSEHCPSKAVDMVPYGDKGLVIPEVNEDLCIGCGACEHACPTRPYRAIYVEGNPVHLVAQKPKEEKLEEHNLEEDFPF